jgi:hypothetical protein
MEEQMTTFLPMHQPIHLEDTNDIGEFSNPRKDLNKWKFKKKMSVQMNTEKYKERENEIYGTDK